VTISAPTPNQVFTIFPGVQSYTQFLFGTTSTFGGISSLTATLNGVPVVFTTSDSARWW